MRSKDTVKIKTVKRLDLGEVWYYEDDIVFQTDNITGSEHFYPLYKWKNYYTYSPLTLLKLKGKLEYNHKIEKYLKEGKVKTYLPPNIFIDKTITRMGGPIIPQKPNILDKNTFIKRFITALVADIRQIESNYENAVFGILTGGKDSLNLLLLPWKSKIVVFSAEPNYQLVKEFCHLNKLEHEIYKLDNEGTEDEKWIENEALIACCRVGLSDIRWSKNLTEIKNKYSSKNENLIVLTGSLADTFLTPYFKTYRCIWKNSLFDKIIYRLGSSNSNFHKSSWIRGAQWQGVFHGIIRESSGLMNFSAYHGKNVLDIIKRVDLESAVKSDIRNLIGEELLGRKVIYPSDNPSPAPWINRQKYSSKETFIQQLNKLYEKNNKNAV